jgi:Flp pilus assembly protein TadD
VRATALAPADPVAWAELGASYAEDDRDPQPGIDALERAQTLGAWDADVNLDLGRLLLRAGRRDAARERFAEVARIADGDPAREAERLLAELAPGAEAP